MKSAPRSIIEDFEGALLPLLPPTHGLNCHPLDLYLLLSHDAWLSPFDENASPVEAMEGSSRMGQLGGGREHDQ